VSGAAEPFPRPTGTPQIVHGDGSPEGRLFAPQGSMYLRRDNSSASSTIYVKTTGVTFSIGWIPISTDAGAAPTGTIQMYGGASAPSASWLLCDGSAKSRALYADLFGVIGTAYGAGDGSSTFNVPDLRGRVGVGFAASGGHTDVSTLGLNEGSALANRRPRHPHSHTLTLPNHGHSDTIGFSDSGHSHGASSDEARHLTGGSGGSGSDYSDATDGGPPGISVATGYANLSKSGSVGNPTSNPSIGGAIGASGVANDAPAYVVVNYLIKT
jgi:microcystin-dependent protein